MLAERWYLALIPITYISALTIAGAGEVHGGSRTRAWASLLVISAAIAAVPALPMRGALSFLVAVAFAGLLAWGVLPSFFATL
jgi:4-hydroxybenzoate polyprenyltransferase